MPLFKSVGKFFALIVAVAIKVFLGELALWMRMLAAS